ncbi:MAG: CHC2 zinc finger domain-containing protein [bacterium]
MKQSTNNYYQELKSALDIIEVARGLLPERITYSHADKLYMDCPMHNSTSKRSLVVDGTRQLWNCFGCGLGGDLIQFVQFANTGKITHGTPLSASHKEARDFLALRANLPPLQELSPELAKKMEDERAEREKISSVFADVVYFFHNKAINNGDVLNWAHEKWGFTQEAFERFSLGYSDNEGLTDYLDKRGHSLADIAMTGAFSFSADRSSLFPLLKNRIVFPFFSGGQIVYLSGRQTPWTPDDDFNSGKKYLKLMLKSEKHPDVSELIRNDYFFNEDTLRRRIEKIVITEGIPDAVALEMNGFPSMSTATVKVPTGIEKRLKHLLRETPKIYVCNDTEDSGIGINNAIETGLMLERAGLDVRIIELPMAGGFDE